MHDSGIPTATPFVTLPRTGMPRILMILGAIIVAGMAALAVTSSGDAALHWWRAYAQNWMYFAAISFGAVFLLAAMHFTRGEWSWSVRRIAGAPAAYLPFAFVTMLPLVFFAADKMLPWINHPVEGKTPYLNVPFFMVRNVVLLALLVWFAVNYVGRMLRPDLAAAGVPADRRTGWYVRLTRNWKGDAAEAVESYKRMANRAPVYGMLYALVMTFLVWDWAMSITPDWQTTMLGFWFLAIGILSGLMTISLLMIWLRRKLSLERYITTDVQMLDIGRLSFAFSAFWGYLLFGMYLVIWYGKIRHEQSWMVARSVAPWGYFFMAMVVLTFILPFMGLVGQPVKRSPKIYRLFAISSLCGLWINELWLSGPSLQQEFNLTATVGVPEIVALAGFGSFFLGAVLWYLQTFPILPSSLVARTWMTQAISSEEMKQAPV